MIRVPLPGTENRRPQKWREGLLPHPYPTEALGRPRVQPEAEGLKVSRPLLGSPLCDPPGMRIDRPPLMTSLGPNPEPRLLRDPHRLLLIGHPILIKIGKEPQV